MVEIALSLAIIGFALVAIIGILPAGLSVQKDNREQTVIDLDAAFLMNAIRNGALGQDDLTNYIISITQTNYAFRTNGVYIANSLTSSTYTRTSTTIAGVTQFYTVLTNGSNIIGLLSLPKYIQMLNGNPPPIYNGYWSNSVTAVFRAINAPAVDQGSSQASQDFAFQYQVTVEIMPSADSPFVEGNGNWENLTSPSNTTSRAAMPTFGSVGDELAAQYLQANLYDVRLTFRWPVLANGKLGGGKQVFRSSVAGSIVQPGNNASELNLDSHSFLQPMTYSTVNRYR
jgi:hypothetical protein